MIVNLDNSAVQSFSLTHRALCPEVKYRSSEIPVTGDFKYFGVTFDNKLNWRLHVETIIERSYHRLTILKRLAGSLWGSATTTPITTYKAFVLPLILCCCEPLITASEQVFKRLEIFHNQAMRLITGGVKSTPIDSMLLLTKLMPIRAFIEEKAVILYEKLYLIGDPFWVNYRDTIRNLKTQCGFIQKTREIRVEYGLSDLIQEILQPTNPLSMIPIEINLELANVVFKSETPTEVLKCLALETINTNYPECDWLQVYTDGSYSDVFMSAGSGVYSSLFSFYASAGKNRNAFDGEVEALRIALKQLLVVHYKFERVVLLSDSKSAIQAISSLETPISTEIVQCRELIQSLMQNGKIVRLQWIPGHSGIFGNDQADFLAKKGATLFQPTNSNMPYHSKRKYIKRTIRERYQLKSLDKIKTKRWTIEELSNLPDYPRRIAVASFRLLTGHDCLGEHLHRIGILAQPFCPLCDLMEPMNRAHLCRCRALLGYDSETARYWRARDCLRQ